MNKILATASVLALMAAAPAWAANPAAAPNGSVAYQPTKTAANGDAAVAPTAQGNQAANTNAANTNNQAANTAAAPTEAANANQAAGTPANAENGQAANSNAAATPNDANQAGAPPNTGNEQAATTGTNETPATSQANANGQAEAGKTNAESTVNNQAAATGANSAEQSVSTVDRNFVKQAASAGMAEVAAGKLAMERASDLAVRQFGRWMVTDHDELAVMLTHRAKAAGIPVPTKLMPQNQTMITTLQPLKGVEFEKQYVEGQVAAHEKAVQLFKTEAKTGQNAGLRALANVGSAMLEQHLAAAQELQGAMPEIVAATNAATKR